MNDKSSRLSTKMATISKVEVEKWSKIENGYIPGLHQWLAKRNKKQVTFIFY